MGNMKCCGAPKSAASVEPVFEARPVGEFSLAGVQRKFSAQMKARALCSACGWSALGHLEDAELEDGILIAGYFVADPVASTDTVT